MTSKPIRSSKVTTLPVSVNAEQTVTLGTVLSSGAQGDQPELLCDDPVMRRHADRSWLKGYMARHIGMPVAMPPRSFQERAVVPMSVWARHALTIGATGSGKSRLTEHLLAQLLVQGQSLVALDPKLETLTRLAVRAQSAGFSPQQVTLLSPRARIGVPGWNPLQGPSLAQSVTDFVAVLERSTTAWGHRLQDVLTNGCLLVGAHNLSVFELVECLRREEYLEGLLRLPSPKVAPPAYREAVRFFRQEFLAWSPSARREAVGPVLNKLRELLRSDFLAPLLCARHTNVDLAMLWQRPGVVLIHLDRATLGEEGARLLGGLAVNKLFRTALRTAGPVAVTLSLDELATAEHFAGQTLVDILSIARSRNLRLVSACQHLAQLSDGLRSALLANTAVQTFFRLGPADARLVAQALAVGTQSRLKRVHIEAETSDRRSGLVPRVQWRHVVRDGCGQPIRLSREAWGKLRWQGMFGSKDAPLADLTTRAAGVGISRLYVQAADTGEPVEVGQYVRGLASGEWWLEGPAPLELVVSFPRPKFSGVERHSESDTAQSWTRTLLDLPVRHAVLRVAEKAPVLIQVAEVTDPVWSREQKQFLASAIKSHGQTAEEIEATRVWREARVEAITRGDVWRDTADHGEGYYRDGEYGEHTEEVARDGSLA